MRLRICMLCVLFNRFVRWLLVWRARAPLSHWHVRVWLLLFNIVVRFLHMHLILVWIVFLVVDPLSGLLFVQNVCVCVPAASMYVFLLLCDFTIDSVSVCMLTCVCVCFEREREKRERERELKRERNRLLPYHCCCDLGVVPNSWPFSPVVIWELFQIHDQSCFYHGKVTKKQV